MVQIGALFQKCGLGLKERHKEGKKLLQMGGQQIAGGVGRAACRVKLLGEIDFLPGLARVVQGADKVHHDSAVLGGFPPGDVVCNFRCDTGQKCGKLVFAGKGGGQLGLERGIGLVKRALTSIPHFQRVALGNLIHVHALPVAQGVGVLGGVDELGFVKLATEERDFADEQAPLLRRNLDAGKAATVRAGRDDRSCNHVRKGLKRALFALVQTHLPHVDETGRVNRADRRGLPGDFLYQLVGNRVNVGRSENSHSGLGGHIRICHFVSLSFTD